MQALADAAVERTSPDSVQHFPQLDGIRGIAILLVLLAHATNFLWVIPPMDSVGYSVWGRRTCQVLLQGWGGVDIFFALSGFLITGILLRARQRRAYFTPFYARRVLRIFPIYYLTLIVMMLLAIPAGSWFRGQIPAGWARVPFLLYVQNWPCFWASWMGLSGLWGVYWSLAVEEQFYLVWPAMIRFFDRRVMLVICWLGASTGWMVRLGLMMHHGSKLGVMQAPFSRLDGLFLGGAFALFHDLYGRPASKAICWVCMAAGIAMLSLVACLHPVELLGSGPHLWAFGPLGFALIGAGLIGISHYRLKLLDRTLTSRPLLLAGKLSYGMYVYHVVIFVGLGRLADKVLHGRMQLGYTVWFAVGYTALGFAAVTGAAWLSFRHFETRFLKLKRRFPTAAAEV